MPATTSALAGLIPLAGAVALTIQGTRRLVAKSREARSSPSPVPQPIEIAPPPKAAPPHLRQRPDGICPECGTTIPARERICAACERKTSATGVNRQLLLHWLVFALMMGAIFGAGWLIAP
jgi:predicted nucleic acid-binding Zn ribbon protein